MSITSRAIITIFTLAISAMAAASVSALAAPNPNSLTKANATSQAAQNKPKSNTNPNANFNANSNNGKSAEARQDACTKVRASIANRTANLQNTGERHLQVIDKVFANLTDFNSRQGLELSPENLAQVAASRETAKQAILTLGQNEDNLNCEDRNVGQMAATVRLSVQAVNDSLKDYRQAVGGALSAARQQLSQKGEVQ